MTARRRIVLLGGTGFIGSALTQKLAADRGTWDLLMLIHRQANLRVLEQTDTVTGSLSSFDLGRLDRFAPQTILHLARLSGKGRWGRLWAATRGARANARIIRHLAARPAKPHVIYVSGTLVYGDCGAEPVDETRPIQPIAFAREYLRAERPWMSALENGAIPTTILRPAWIMGQGSWFEEIYVKGIRIHRTIPLFGEGRNLMSLLDVEDCAGLIQHAVREAKPGRYYNLFAPGACVTQQEFVERLAKLTGAEVRRVAESSIRRQYGQAMLEAVTFSNRSATQYPEFMGGYSFKFPLVDDMIRHNLPAELGGSR